MNPKIVRILTIAMALTAILSFASIYVFEIYKAFSRCQIVTSSNALVSVASEIKDPYAYVATALVGLIAGVVAVVFGQPVPAMRAENNFWKTFLVAAYCFIYLAAGIVSLVAWMLPNTCASVLVRNLALNFIGLLVPVVASFFKQNSVTAILGLSSNTDVSALLASKKS